MRPFIMSLLAIAGTASAGSFYVLTDDQGNLAGDSVSGVFSIFADDNNAYCDDADTAPDGSCGITDTTVGATCSADWGGHTWTATFGSYDSGFGVASGSIADSAGPTIDLTSDSRCESYSCTYGGALSVQAYKGFRCVIDI